MAHPPSAIPGACESRLLTGNPVFLSAQNGKAFRRLLSLHSSVSVFFCFENKIHRSIPDIFLCLTLLGLWCAGGGGVGAQEQEPREDARVRPRRARRHAPRRRQDTQGPRAPPQGTAHTIHLSAQLSSVSAKHSLNFLFALCSLNFCVIVSRPLAVASGSRVSVRHSCRARDSVAQLC